MFEQKFTQIGANNSTTNFASNPTTSSSIQSKNSMTKPADKMLGGTLQSGAAASNSLSQIQGSE